MIRLFLDHLQDEKLRENFVNILSFIEKTPFAGSKVSFREFEVGEGFSVTPFKFPHRLNFTPKDAFVTSKTGVADVSFRHDLFDADNIFLTASAAIKVRCLVGNFE